MNIAECGVGVCMRVNIIKNGLFSSFSKRFCIHPHFSFFIRHCSFCRVVPVAVSLFAVLVQFIFIKLLVYFLHALRTHVHTQCICMWQTLNSLARNVDGFLLVRLPFRGLMFSLRVKPKHTHASRLSTKTARKHFHSL